MDNEREVCWPELHYQDWKDTCATLHMWSQIVGKIRLMQTPLVNHWWNVPLYVTPRGLTTTAMPYGRRLFQIDFDFVDHCLDIRTDDGKISKLELLPQTVAEFYKRLMTALDALGLSVKIYGTPVEIPNPIPFVEDTVHSTYDREMVDRFRRVLMSADRVFNVFRSRFQGKCSPVHFFWGSFDLAVTRFSGRPAPERPGADPITKEAYSHEVISHGYWPGSEGGDAKFYAYAAPEPDGFKTARALPEQAGYDKTLNEFLLSYEAVRTAESPESDLLDFMQSTYDAGADLANWDRQSLEKPAS